MHKHRPFNIPTGRGGMADSDDSGMVYPAVAPVRGTFRARPKLVEVNIYSDEIFKAIDNDTQFLAQMSQMRQTSASKDSHSLSTDEKTREFLSRHLDLYYNKAEHLCMAYMITGDENHISVDNASTKWKKRTIWLRMPHDWSLSAAHEIANTISHFIISGMEYEFCTDAYGAASDIAQQRYQALVQASSAITSALSERTPAQRNAGYPYWL